jgi:hypothetical protein
MTKKKVDERSFYEPIRKWLESKGYNAVIEDRKRKILLSTGALLGIGTIEPDVVGYKKENYTEYLVIVEAKTDPMFLFDGLGRCFVYKTVANYVYLALPKEVAEKIGTGSLFEERYGVGLGVGVIGVDPETKEVEERVEAKEITSWRNDLREALVGMVKSALGIKE